MRTPIFLANNTPIYTNIKIKVDSKKSFSFFNINWLSEK